MQNVVNGKEKENSLVARRSVEFENIKQTNEFLNCRHYKPESKIFNRSQLNINERVTCQET
jgi:hypothetical protein